MARGRVPPTPSQTTGSKGIGPLQLFEEEKRLVLDANLGAIPRWLSGLAVLFGIALAVAGFFGDRGVLRDNAYGVGVILAVVAARLFVVEGQRAHLGGIARRLLDQQAPQAGEGAGP